MMSQTSKQFRISIARAWVSALMRVNEILRARADKSARASDPRKETRGIRDYSAITADRACRSRARDNDTRVRSSGIGGKLEKRMALFR